MKTAIACFVLIFTMVTSHAAMPPAGGRVLYRPGEVLVKFRDAGSLDAVRAKSALGLSIAGSYLDGRWQKLALPPVTTVPKVLALLRNEPAVESAQPNYLKFPLQAVPNDPLFDQQWGIRNTGQANFVPGGPAGVPGGDMNLLPAWDPDGDGTFPRVGDGSVTVAVIDDAVETAHPDLKANIVAGHDFKNNDGDPNPDNADESHGTTVAGAIGAVGNNGEGVAGAIWHVKLMPLKFDFDTTTEVQAMEFARDHGARIINASFGGPMFDQMEFDAIKDLRDNGILLVAAPGNEDSNLDDSVFGFPANYDLPNIVAAAATNRQDQIASFSTFGPVSVDVAAPGLQIVTTTTGGAYTTNPGVSGTSYSSPYTAGVAALILNTFPQADFRELRARLIEGAKPGDGDDLRTAGGRIDAAASLALAPGPSLVIDKVQVDPQGNGALDPGEDADLVVTVRNIWQAADDVRATLTADNGITIGGGEQMLGALPANGTATVTFPAAVPADLAGHRFVFFKLALTAAGGYSATRSFIEEAARLTSGQSVSDTLSSGLYDDFKTWHVDVPAGTTSLTFKTTSPTNIDILVKHGAPPQYDIQLAADPDSDPPPLFFTDVPEAQIGREMGGNETVTIQNPQAGVWFVTVVNFALAQSNPYTLSAEAVQPPPPPPPASPKKGGGALDLMLLIGLVLAAGIRRRK